MSRIFITYRREDSSSQAGRVYDWLGDHYGREVVFKDIDSIDPGRPWRQAIDTAVSSADVVVAMIGPQWLAELQARSGSDDYVRYELEAAIRQDRRIIPLLVNGAKMPEPDELPPSLAILTEIHAFDVSDARFRSDMEELLRRLDRVVTPQPAPTRSHARPERAAPPQVEPRAAEPDELERELKKWNWGAFLLTFIWGIGNGVPRSFLTLIPFYGLYEWFLLGINGNRWAWEKRRWESIEQFHRSQRAWAKGGVITLGVLFFLYILLVAAGSSA